MPPVEREPFLTILTCDHCYKLHICFRHVIIWNDRIHKQFIAIGSIVELINLMELHLNPVKKKI